jgi:hypothetical protein
MNTRGRIYWLLALALAVVGLLLLSRKHEPAVTKSGNKTNAPASAPQNQIVEESRVKEDSMCQILSLR